MKSHRKLRKRLLLPMAVLVIAIVVTGIAVALPNKSPAPHQKRTASTQQADSVKTVSSTPTVSVPATQKAATPVATTSQITADPTPPTPDENKVAIMAKITDYAASRGWSQNTTYWETTCFDRSIANSVGYADYNALFDSTQYRLLNEYLAGNFMFDGATCNMDFFSQN